MAKLKFSGLDEYVSQLKTLVTVSEVCIGRAVHDGAGVVADAMKAAIESLPIDERYVRPGNTLNGISSLQKKGLIEGFGIATLRNDNGYLNVKLGFDGYNGVKTKQFPSGQPNAMIARSINAGTSFRQRVPFIDNTVRQQKDACEKKMKETFDKELKKVIR